MAAHWALASGLAATGLLIASAASVALSARAPAQAKATAGPAVVELFQSQGCSSCPPADKVLAGLADRPDVIALSYAVTYWDGQGWKDTFAKPAFTSRQRDYASARHDDEVYTPQMIVNGRTELIGTNAREVERAIKNAPRPTQGPEITSWAGKVKLGAVPDAAGAATVWLVRYDPHVIHVPIGGGENAGRTLPHRDVVRDLVKLGGWSGTAQDYALPKPSQGGLAGAVLVQAGTGGSIIAAAKL